MMEATVFFGTLHQICASTQSCLGALRKIPSTSWLGLALTCTVNCGFTTGGLQSSCTNISWMINGNRMHLCSILSLIAMGLNSYVNKVSVFYV